jgi:hypothetical protein
MKTTFTATLTLEVKFDIDHDECKEASMDPEKVETELIDQLERIPDYLSGEGMLTYDLPATVDTWSAKVVVK